MERDNWTEFAEGYDQKVFSLTSIPKRMQQILDATKPGRVLNLGCGPTNYLNFELATNRDHVVAVDFCKEMIKVAKKEFTHPNLEYIVADGKKLPFDSESFDTVISVNSLIPPNRMDVFKMLKESNRVLKKEGKLVAFLPSYDNVLKAKRNLGLKIETDDYLKRIKDTTGWQCFHTPFLIEFQMFMTQFRKSEYKKVFLKTKKEISELKRLYELDTSKSMVYEYFLVAEK